MKVLGILPRDMQPRGREEYPEGMPGEIRHDAWEKKRRQLMHSVSGMAADRSLDLTKSASAVELGQPSDATNAFLADVMAREQESIVKMRTRAQADVQKIVLYEMEAKKEVEIREAKLEEHRKRMVELKKKQDEKLLAQQKEAQKKYEKSVEVRRRADLKLEQESEELWKEICVKDERVQGVLKEREEGWEQNRITKQAERRQNYDRIAIFKSGDMKVREKAWSGIVKKDKAAEERLEKVRNEMWAQQAAMTYRTDEAVKKSRDTIAAAQAGKDAAYLEREKVHAKKKRGPGSNRNRAAESICSTQQKESAKLREKLREGTERARNHLDQSQDDQKHVGELPDQASLEDGRLGEGFPDSPHDGRTPPLEPPAPSASTCASSAAGSPQDTGRARPSCSTERQQGRSSFQTNRNGQKLRNRETPSYLPGGENPRCAARKDEQPARADGLACNQNEGRSRG